MLQLLTKSSPGALKKSPTAGKMELLLHSDEKMQTPNRPTVHVIVPVFNRVAKTLLCLECLSKQTYPAINIIVVDDGSTDGTPSIIASVYPDCQILRTNGNRWWTGATNDGISLACKSASNKDYVLLLNNDLVFQPNLVAQLVNFAMKRHDQSIVSAITVSNNDTCTILDGGTQINWWTAKRDRPNRGKRAKDFPHGYTQDVSVLTGRGVLYPVKAFVDHGLFDDKHFQQCGDFSLPAYLRKRGYKLVMYYDAIVYAQIEDTSQINCCYNYNLSQLREYLFSTRSNTNIRYRYYLGKYGATSIQFPFFLLSDYLRILTHFFRRLVLPSNRKTSISELLFIAMLCTIN